MSARLSARSTAKINAEKRLVRQREKEHEYRTGWDNQVAYYKTWEKKNNRYEDWTSPRYYETNNQTIEAHRKKQEHDKNLEKRRDALQTLLREEKRSHEIEMMVKNRHAYEKPKVPTEVLKEINVGIKIAEEDRRKHQAELALYHQWRNNNPILRQHERAINNRDLKLTWLDQQVNKRVQKEKDEEEIKQMVNERNRRIAEESAREEQLKRETAEKNEKLLADLAKQMEELRVKQEESDKLRREEEEHARHLAKLAEAQEQQEEIKRQVIKRELVLENLKQHKLRLKQKATDVRNSLQEETDLVKKILDAELVEKMAETTKKEEVQKTMVEFLKFARDQRELERQREKHFDFIFDSEAKTIYEKQQEVWRDEQKARSALLKDVLDTIKEQVEEKVMRNKEKQRETLEERREILKQVEEYENDVAKLQMEEQKKREEWKQAIDQQIKEKRACERETKLKEESQLEQEVEAARREEERLRHEILKLQQKCGPIKPSRSRIFL